MSGTRTAAKRALPPAPEEQSTPLRILAAAEAEFAEGGYDGTPLRRIAERAGVPLGLVTYHYKTKLGVYRAIFEARAPAVIEQRRIGLAMARLEPDPARRLELVVKSLLVPMLRLREAEHSSLFGILLAREVGDPRNVERGIIRDMFDPIATIFTEEMAGLLPGRSKAQVHWAYQSVIAVMVYVMSDSGRIARVSAGAADPNDVEATLNHVISILLNGITRAV